MKKLLTALAASSIFVSPAYAETAIIGFTSGSTANVNGVDLPRTVGFSFTPTIDILVSHLGFFDIGNDGLTSSHQVGIWSSAGDLLLSDVVASGTSATLLDGFRYVDSADLFLAANTSYVIGAAINQGSNEDSYIFGPSSVQTSSLIDFGNGLRGPANVAFAFPSVNPNSGRFGPNFQFSAAVPEPATWAFMIFGFGAIGGAMRRQRKANVKVSYA